MIDDMIDIKYTVHCISSTSHNKHN